MKKLLALLLSSFSLLHAADIIAPESVDQWQKIRGDYTIELVQDGGLTAFLIRGVCDIRSQQMLTIDPRKTYKLTGEFRAADGTVPAKIFFGVIELDANNSLITSNNVFSIKGSETILAADVKPGDTQIKIRDASKWQRNVPCSVAFNAAADFSDLPNRTLSPAVQAITENDGIYILTLASPMRHAYSAGTPVRQHRFAGSYHYTHGNKQLTTQWQSFSIIIHGQASYGVPTHRWWRGVKQAGLLLLANYGGNADSAMLIRNIKLEELTR